MKQIYIGYLATWLWNGGMVEHQMWTERRQVKPTGNTWWVSLVYNCQQFTDVSFVFFSGEASDQRGRESQEPAQSCVWLVCICLSARSENNKEKLHWKAKVRINTTSELTCLCLFSLPNPWSVTLVLKPNIWSWNTVMEFLPIPRLIHALASIHQMQHHAQRGGTAFPSAAPGPTRGLAGALRPDQVSGYSSSSTCGGPGLTTLHPHQNRAAGWSTGHIQASHGGVL